MRIAHFIQRYPPALGGAEAYFARLSRWFAAQDDEVTVFTTNAISLEAFWNQRGQTTDTGMEPDGKVTVRRYAVRHWPARRYLLKALSFFPHRPWQCLTMPCNPIAPAMWRDCGREPRSFDAVHASAFPYAWQITCGLRLARRLGVPFLLTPFLHLGDPDDAADRSRRAYLSSPLQWLLHQADAVFAQTPTERDALLNIGVRPERVHLQGLGVDPAECTGGNRQAARNRWRADEASVVVGHLANNSLEKGTIDLLLAVEQLWRRGVPIHVVLAGPQMPNFRAFWGEFAARHRERIERQVIHLGPLTEAQKRDFFAGIDVFALPSRSDSFGLVLLEAWANGVPNVAYRAGGIADVIRPGVDGLLAPCGDVRLLAEAIARLHGDAVQRRQLGDAGRARLSADFHWPEKLALVRDVCRDLVDQSKIGRTTSPDTSVSRKSRLWKR